MANNRNGNVIWADTASTSFPDDKNIVGIVVRCTSGTDARITLGNNNSARSYPTLFDIEVPHASNYAYLDFSRIPIYFPDGIRIKTLTNATITIILDKTKGT